MVEPMIRVRRLDGRAALPAYQTAGSAGLDLSACLDGELAVEPGRVELVPTGLAVAIESGYEGQVRARSSVAVRHAVLVPNAPGTIDSDYRGELRVGLLNAGRERFVVRHGDRIAQLVIAPVARARVEEVDLLDETERGEGGFGSTGRR